MSTSKQKVNTAVPYSKKNQERLQAYMLVASLGTEKRIKK
jgi:hypothetical protein